MTEDQLEQEALSYLVETGYSHVYGPAIAPEGEYAERADSISLCFWHGCARRLPGSTRACRWPPVKMRSLK